MARKRSRNTKFNLGKVLLNNSLVKIVLGVVATGSFAIAFGQEKIAQFMPFSSGTSTECLKQFYREEPPFLVKDSLNKNSYPLCFNGFNVMYSGVSKTPLWTAEHLSPQRLSQKIKREDSFHEELRVNAEHRALLKDYKGSGYDRGHMSPNGDMPTKQSQADSFSLANMVPQAPKNNQQVWRELEEATRAMATKQKQDVYVVTGPVFSGKKLSTIGNGVIVPTAVFKAIYIPKEGIIGAYYAPNNNSLQVKILSVCQLEELTGINIFPQLTEEQKRNTYKLPLSTAQVKANQKIAYSHWDGESQCAPDVSADQLQALQKKFKSKNGPAETNISVPKVDGQTQDALVKQLVEALLQYLLQILK
ncbi:DNA/RNA non-specific endonuclease [Acinetobacter sp. ANC 3832]|uniref:DNA/RNA non-specific endonuclease n=1 Tax=Acinetobacter sp. ANC 3832 TaxID=1977874 RepID=UPI000A35A83C|nr:DNA/RNA non-specific endonuclease [Acinetobacter sp. ANC 3832]OTG95644.1 endonuclease [Acinetobacter sp. ANC 3832]